MNRVRIERGWRKTLTKLVDETSLLQSLVRETLMTGRRGGGGSV